jgi:hypothetical protein
MSYESIADSAQTVTYTGAGLSVAAAAPHYVFGLTMDEWSVIGIIFGMVMAFAGWLTTVWFRRKQLQIASQGIRGD